MQYEAKGRRFNGSTVVGHAHTGGHGPRLTLIPDRDVERIQLVGKPVTALLTAGRACLATGFTRSEHKILFVCYGWVVSSREELKRGEHNALGNSYPPRAAPLYWGAVLRKRIVYDE